VGTTAKLLGLSSRVLARGSQMFARGSRWLDELDQREGLIAGECPTKLNVGCGYDKREGYLNIDVDPACAPDLLILNNNYSTIPRNYFEEVLAKDVLEHIYLRETPNVLLDFADYLVDGGKLVIQTPSIPHLAAKLQATKRFDEQWVWTVCLFGNQQHPGDCHYAGWSEVTLQTLLIAAGFTIETFELREAGWNFYVEATKTADWTSLLESSSDLTDLSFLRRAYHEVLGRDADETEIQHSGEALRKGVTRKQVLKHLFSAPERLSTIAEQYKDKLHRISTLVPQQHNSARISKITATAPSLEIAVETEDAFGSFAVSFVLETPQSLSGVGEPRVVIDLEVIKGVIGVGCTNADYTSWLDHMQVVSTGRRTKVYVPFGAPFSVSHLVFANYSPEGHSVVHIHGIEIRRVPLSNI